MASKKTPEPERDKTVDVCEDFSLCPVRIGRRWYIEHGYTQYSGQLMVYRWRAFKRRYTANTDKVGAYYPSLSVCRDAIRMFIEKCIKNKWGGEGPVRALNKLLRDV